MAISARRARESEVMTVDVREIGKKSLAKVCPPGEMRDSVSSGDAVVVPEVISPYSEPGFVLTVS